ncbi:teichoic acid glycosylation protein GtcA [Enterococcus florum]|uniref:Teichoic acid glycosylation protein GtcA n=1 Tax=Enterococcus florum TaxID=2480627 RepID=A0A4P5P438_9ENTE|nr:GtrA family protein [Enterococcus florum]GCF92360.1 teichoic acid glycosylation protein GtcA [Enterococcus florum]
MKRYLKFVDYLKEKNLWEIFVYLFFGGLTTVVNIVVFALFHEGLKWGWPTSNAISWVASVLFAFVTNKIWVFHSKTETFGELLIEFSKFLVARIVSFGLDMGSMYVLIDLLTIGNFIAKLITQVLVVVANYVFSKVFIFKKVRVHEEKE